MPHPTAATFPAAPPADGSGLEYKALGLGAYDSAVPAEVSRQLDPILTAFEAFKATNDERVAQIERHLAADPLTTDKLARIERTLDQQQRAVTDLALKAARPNLGGGTAGRRPIRRWNTKPPLPATCARATPPGCWGSNARRSPWARRPTAATSCRRRSKQRIGAALKLASPIRAIATVLEISSGTYKKAFATTGAEAGWVGEAADRPQTASPRIAELSFPAMELYANPAATLTLLDDARIDVDTWLAGEVRTAFAKQEGQAFVTGDGVNRPKGFLAYPKVANGAWSWGNIGVVPSGAAGAFAATDPAAALIDLVYALKSPYRIKGRFVMNRMTQSAVRKLKDGSGPIPLAALAGGRRAVHPDGLSGQRMRGHARHRRRRPRAGVRRFRARVPGGRPGRDPRAARSVCGEAVCAVLHDQTRRRRRAGLRRDQADEVCGELTVGGLRPKVPGRGG